VEWVGAIGVIAAAIVTGLFSMNLRRLNRDNTEQHNRSIDKLDHLSNQVEGVAENVTGLTVWTKVHDEKHRWIDGNDRG
jgi:hypothetical protein